MFRLIAYPGPLSLRTMGRSSRLRLVVWKSRSIRVSMADGLPYGVIEPARAYTIGWADHRPVLRGDADAAWRLPVASPTEPR